MIYWLINNKLTKKKQKRKTKKSKIKKLLHRNMIFCIHQVYLHIKKLQTKKNGILWASHEYKFLSCFTWVHEKSLCFALSAFYGMLCIKLQTNPLFKMCRNLFKKLILTFIRYVNYFKWKLRATSVLLYVYFLHCGGICIF